jgi:hypothetical protein
MECGGTLAPLGGCRRARAARTVLPPWALTFGARPANEREHPMRSPFRDLASPMSQKRPVMLGLALVLLGAACGGAAQAAGPPDEPVPASEPREELVVRIDLPRTPRCDEAFELALYGDRGVELIQWSPLSRSCVGRIAQVRFLPKRLGREKLLETMRAHATSVSTETVK